MGSFLRLDDLYLRCETVRLPGSAVMVLNPAEGAVGTECDVTRWTSYSEVM